MCFENQMTVMLQCTDVLSESFALLYCDVFSTPILILDTSAATDLVHQCDVYTRV